MDMNRLCWNPDLNPGLINPEATSGETSFRTVKQVAFEYWNRWGDFGKIGRWGHLGKNL